MLANSCNKSGPASQFRMQVNSTFTVNAVIFWSSKANTWRLENISCNKNEPKEYTNTWQIRRCQPNSGFAKSRPAAQRPAAHGPPRPRGPAARRPSGPRSTARHGPAASGPRHGSPRPGGPRARWPSPNFPPEFHSVFCAVVNPSACIDLHPVSACKMDDGEFEFVYQLIIWILGSVFFFLAENDDVFH